MKLSTLFVIGAIVTLVFGLAFILFPVQTMSIYGVTLDISGQFIARYLGAAFLGLSALAWLARNTPPSEARRAIVYGFFVTSVLGFAVALWDVFAGSGNALVWTTVVLFLLFAIGYGYFSFIKSEA